MGGVQQLISRPHLAVADFLLATAAGRLGRWLAAFCLVPIDFFRRGTGTATGYQPAGPALGCLLAHARVLSGRDALALGRDLRRSSRTLCPGARGVGASSEELRARLWCRRFPSGGAMPSAGMGAGVAASAERAARGALFPRRGAWGRVSAAGGIGAEPEAPAAGCARLEWTAACVPIRSSAGCVERPEWLVVGRRRWQGYPRPTCGAPYVGVGLSSLPRRVARFCVPRVPCW